MIVCKTALENQKMRIHLRSPLASAGTVSVIIMDYDGTTLSEGATAPLEDSWTLTAGAGRGTSDPRILQHIQGEGTGNPPVPPPLPTPGWYFLEGADGSIEKVRVISATATRITCSAPVKLAYPSGSILSPAVVEYTIPEDAVASAASITANVSYVQKNGALTAYNEEGYVSDAPAGNPLSVDYLLQAYPQLESMTQIAGSPEEFQLKLDHVWDGVRSRLLSMGLSPEQFKAVAVLRQVVVYEFLLQIALGGTDPTGAKDSSAYAERIDGILERKWSELHTTKQFIDQEKSDKHNDLQRGLGRRIEW